MTTKPNKMETKRRLKANIISLFNRTANEYDQIVPFFSAFGEKMVKQLHIQQGNTVLDVAAGRGALIWPAVNKVGAKGDITAIDLSIKMVSLLRKDVSKRKLTNVRVLRIHAEKLAFRNAFDFVVCGFAIHLFPNPKKALTAIYKSLKPGGVFAFSLPGLIRSKKWDFYAKILSRHSPQLNATRWQHTKLNNAKELLLHAGFKNVTTHAEVIRVPVKNPETFWKSELSHGCRNFIEALSRSTQIELKHDVLEALQHMHEHGGIVLERGAVFYQAVKPKRS